MMLTFTKGLKFTNILIKQSCKVYLYIRLKIPHLQGSLTMT